MSAIADGWKCFVDYYRAPSVDPPRIPPDPELLNLLITQEDAMVAGQLARGSGLDTRLAGTLAADVAGSGVIIAARFAAKDSFHLWGIPVVIFLAGIALGTATLLYAGTRTISSTRRLYAQIEAEDMSVEESKYFIWVQLLRATSLNQARLRAVGSLWGLAVGTTLVGALTAFILFPK